MATIDVKGLTIEYRSGPYAVRPIDGFDLELESGQLVLLLGASGCGKTSLLSVLAGILTPQGGTTEVNGQRVDSLSEAELVAYRRSTVGVVFQSFNLVPSLTALENVAVPLWSAGIRGKRAAARATVLLDQVGLGDRLRHRPSEMSGGQQQRVAIARALAHDPPVLLADEPTAHLDTSSVEEVLRVLRGLAQSGRLVVIATHDHRLLPVADRVIELGVAGAPPASDKPKRLKLRPGQRLFAEGTTGDLVYFVHEGSVELVRNLADGGEEHVATVGPGGYFGELSPMLQLPRSATARAQADGAVVIGLTLATFRRRTKDDSTVNPPARRATTPSRRVRPSRS
jgi:putative ABC transport system ATP-binding protein